MARRKEALPCNTTEVIREGHLTLFQRGALKKNKGYYVHLIAASQSGVARLELYENEKHSATLQPTFMVVGNDVVKVEMVTLAAKDMRNAFLISTKEQHYTFYVDDHWEREKWVKDIQETLLGEAPVPRSPQDMNIVTEVNEIYEPADKFFPQTKEFIVTIDEKTRPKMGVDGKVRLIVENESIAIITPSGKMIVRWALKNVRKFSYQATTFIVEAGRKSDLGEGNFVFLTDEGGKIFSLIDVKKRELKLKHTIQATHHAVTPEPSSIGAYPAASKISKPEPLILPPSNDDFDPSYLGNNGIYDTLENVLPPPSTKSSGPHAGNKSPPVEIKSERPPISVNPYPPSTSIKSSATSQSKPVKQQTPKVDAKDDTTNQGRVEIYSEPQLITDAWKVHARNDSEDIYSNLNFSSSQEEEGHYWRGCEVMQQGNAKQEKEPDAQVEDIYAQVDFSKKTRNRK